MTIRGSLLIAKLVRFHVLLLIVAGLVASAARVVVAQDSAVVAGVPVTIEKIDGTVVEGRWGGGESGDAVKVETSAGVQELRLDDLARVVFSRTAGIPATGGTFFHLADGGLLVGNLLGSEGDSLVGRTSLGESTYLAFERLAGVELARRDEFPEAARRFAASLSDRLAAKDVLITRDTDDDVTTVRGRVVSLDPVTGKFALGGSVRSFQTEKIFGLVFAAGSSRGERYPATLRLRDGTEVSGAIERATRDRISFTTSLGSSTEVRLDRVLEIVVHSPRLVYVTDLSIQSESSEGRLHPGWSVGVDRNVSGGVLAIAGREFERGLGMHSKGEVRYSLDGAYELFVATIGLDDAVRPRGSVVFRVVGDGRELFNSGLVSGTDEPGDVRIDVREVKRLTLLVDYGDELDLSDYADWGDARLIKPKEGR